MRAEYIIQLLTKGVKIYGPKSTHVFLCHNDIIFLYVDWRLQLFLTAHLHTWEQRQDLKLNTP